MNSPRKQRGVSLLEIFIALTAAIAATGVALTMYLQSNSDTLAASTKQTMQMLYSEMDRAYPRGVYTSASDTDLLATMRPDSSLVKAGQIALQAGAPITITPGAPNNGVVDSAVLSVPFSSTRVCVGVIDSTIGLPFDARVGTAVAVESGVRVSSAAVADACDGGSGVVTVVVRAGERP